MCVHSKLPWQPERARKRHLYSTSGHAPTPAAAGSPISVTVTDGRTGMGSHAHLHVRCHGCCLPCRADAGADAVQPLLKLKRSLSLLPYQVVLVARLPVPVQLAAAAAPTTTTAQGKQACTSAPAHHMVRIARPKFCLAAARAGARVLTAEPSRGQEDLYLTTPAWARDP